MIRTVLEAKGLKADILDLIKDEVLDDTTIFQKEAVTKDGQLLVVMYEKYFLRINSELNVTIFYEEIKDLTRIEMIASGGSVGFIRTSYGAENKALEAITAKLVELGYEIKEQTE